MITTKRVIDFFAKQLLPAFIAGAFVWVLFRFGTLRNPVTSVIIFYAFWEMTALSMNAKNILEIVREQLFGRSAESIEQLLAPIDPGMRERVLALCGELYNAPYSQIVCDIVREIECLVEESGTTVYEIAEATCQLDNLVEVIDPTKNRDYGLLASLKAEFDQWYAKMAANNQR